MYAGGLSYFSSGSFLGTLRVGASWAEAAASPDSKTRQVKKRVLDTIKYLQLKTGDRISERTRGVHQIFSTQNRGRGMGRILLGRGPNHTFSKNRRSLKIQIILAENQNAHRSIYRVMFSLLLLTAVWQHALKIRPHL